LLPFRNPVAQKTAEAILIQKARLLVLAGPKEFSASDDEQAGKAVSFGKNLL
jgi:hypothetical protein